MKIMKTITLAEYSALNEQDFEKMLLENGCTILRLGRRHYLVSPSSCDYSLEANSFRYAWNWFYGALIKN